MYEAEATWGNMEPRWVGKPGRESYETPAIKGQNQEAEVARV